MTGGDRTDRHGAGARDTGPRPSDDTGQDTRQEDTDMRSEHRTDWSRAVRLTSVEFLACWAALRLGDTPLALELRSVGVTLDDRDRIYRDALTRLGRRGLVDPAAPALPCPPLAGALRLLATAPYLADLRLAAHAGTAGHRREGSQETTGTGRQETTGTGRQETTRTGSQETTGTGRSRGGSRLDDGKGPAELMAIGAMAREFGVLAVRVGAELSLLPVAGPWVPSALVELIGPLDPARARPVNIPAELLDRACRAASADGADGAMWALADRLVEYGVLPADASSLARMCTGLTAAGQLGATARDPGGRERGERRGRWVVGFHRARAGDCLQLRRPTGPGQETVTIAPITADKLLGQLIALLDDLGATASPGPAHPQRAPGGQPRQMAYGHPVNA
jgi:EspG family